MAKNLLFGPTLGLLVRQRDARKGGREGTPVSSVKLRSLITLGGVFRKTFRCVRNGGETVCKECLVKNGRRGVPKLKGKEGSSPNQKEKRSRTHESVNVGHKN